MHAMTRHRALIARAALATFPLLWSGGAHAGSSTGAVTELYAHSGDIVMFTAGSHTGKPACSTVGDEWAFSLTTQSGRAMYALLLSAQAQGKAVRVVGDNNCSAWGDREAVRYIRLTL